MRVNCYKTLFTKFKDLITSYGYTNNTFFLYVFRNAGLDISI